MEQSIDEGLRPQRALDFWNSHLNLSKETTLRPFGRLPSTELRDIVDEIKKK